MPLKLNASKIGGFLLAAMIAVVSCSIVFAPKPAPDTIEGLRSPAEPDTPNESSANNVTMKLMSAHTEGSVGYRVELCYSLPDQRDWILASSNAYSGTTLSVADIKVYPIEEGTMYWKFDGNGNIAQRCQYVFFVLRIPSPNETLYLRVERLYARKLGQPDYCLEVSQKMVERGYTVTIDCMKLNGFEGLVYVKFPTELISMDPVFQKIFQDVKWDTYAGPWSFTFPVNPP